MKLINLDELNERIKAIKRPTPYQVIDLITAMYAEIKLLDEHGVPHGNDD